MRAFRLALREPPSPSLSSSAWVRQKGESGPDGVDKETAATPVPIFGMFTALSIGLFRNILELAKAGTKGLVPEAPPPDIPDVVIECPHDYASNSNLLWRICLPGALGVRVVFSEDSSTENNYDYVNIYAEESRATLLGGKFTGRKGSVDKVWPGVAGRAPLLIEGRSECWVHFVSDGSNNDWGFKLTASAITKYDLELQNYKLMQSHASFDSRPDRFSFPSLSFGLAVLDLTLDFSRENFSRILSSNTGASLYGGLSNCVGILGTAHPAVTGIFIKVVSKLMHFITCTRYGVSSNSPDWSVGAAATTHRSLSAWSGANTRLFLIELARRVKAMAAKALAIRKMKGLQKEQCSPLLQAVLQAAVLADNADVLPVANRFRVPVSPDSLCVECEELDAAAFQPVYCGRGMRKLPGFPGARLLMGPPLRKSPQDSAGGNALLSTHLKVVRLGQTGTAIGIIPGRDSRDLDTSALSSLFWRADGSLLNRQEILAEKKLPSFSENDIIGVTAVLMEDRYDVYFSRNGVFVALVVGSPGSGALIEQVAEKLASANKFWSVGVLMADADDEVCLTNLAHDQVSLDYTAPLKSAATLTKEVLVGCMRLTAAGEGLPNLLSDGEEVWNKWTHPNATSSWVSIDFLSLPEDAVSTARPGGASPSLRLKGYSLRSANDSPGKDPVSWSVMGKSTADGEWVLLHRSVSSVGTTYLVNICDP